MKKLLAAAFVFALTLSLAACSDGNTPASAPSSDAPSAEPVAEPDAEPVAEPSSEPDAAPSSSPASVASTAPASESNTGNHTPSVPVSSNSPYSGTYTGAKGTMIVTDTSITIDWNGTSYSIDDYVLKDNQGIMQLDFSSNGAEIRIVFTRDEQFAEVYVNNSGDMFTKGNKEDTTPSSTTAAGNYSSMAGSYTGGYGTLTISADGSFTWVCDGTNVKDTFNGKLPANGTSGDAVTVGNYIIKFTYPDDYSSISIDLKDASGTSVGGDDMVRS